MTTSVQVGPDNVGPRCGSGGYGARHLHCPPSTNGGEDLRPSGLSRACISGSSGNAATVHAISHACSSHAFSQGGGVFFEFRIHSASIAQGVHVCCVCFEFRIAMARAPALRNRPVRELDPQTRARWEANRYSRLYVAMLVRRCEAREYARELLVDLFRDVVHRIEAQARRRRDTIAQLRKDAKNLEGRRPIPLPVWPLADRGLPAATLSDRAAAARRARRRERFATLRKALTGQEFHLSFDTGMNCHEFYQQARAVLGLEKHVSLALLRIGSGTKEQRLLTCDRDTNLWRQLQFMGTVFEAVCM